jgi:hypothetical protein
VSSDAVTVESANSIGDTAIVATPCETAGAVHRNLASAPLVALLGCAPAPAPVAPSTTAPPTTASPTTASPPTPAVVREDPPVAVVRPTTARGGKEPMSTSTSDRVIDGIRVTFSGPRSLPLAVVTRGDPAFDGSRSIFTVTLRNESDRERRVPLDELRRSLVRVYVNPATRAESIDNRGAPPRAAGIVEALPPGATRDVQVPFAYPVSIATMEHGVAQLRFCVRWESGWLRSASYPSGTIDWNPSFELCEDVRIVQ